jgi:type IV pilus assembly protein PilC
VVAVFIVAGLIYVLGILPAVEVAGKPQKLDPIGLGMVGPEGAIFFLEIVFGGIAALVILYRLLRRLLRQRAIVERILLQIPLLGTCLRDIALTRFSFAMRLMLDSSMSILQTIRLAFRATDNQAFISVGGIAESQLRRGNSIVTGLTVANRFPSGYLSSVAIGEESGHLPEVMAQLAEYHDERAKKSMILLNRILGTLVWLFVAVFVVFLIFKVYTKMYIGNIQPNLPK